jgi:protein O-mannosyl-transferase
MTSLDGTLPGPVASDTGPQVGPRRGIALAVLLAATLCAFSPLFSGEAEFLAWDDNANIVYQRAVHGWSTENLVSAWNGSTTSQGLYEPLSVMLQMTTIELFGLQARPFHVLSLALHVANAWLLSWLALLLIRNCDASLREKLRPEQAALVAALLFALHPMRVEVVAWATGQSYALGGLFLFLSLIGYVRYVEARQGRGAGRPALLLALSVLFYACAVLSKAAAIFLPPALLLLDAFPFRRKLEPGVLLDKLPHALVGTALFAIILSVTSGRQGSGYLELDLVPRIAYALNSLPFHLGKTLWPASVHPAYGVLLPDVSPFTGPFLFSTTIVVAGAVLAWALRTRAPWLSVALGIFALGMLPVGGFFKHGDALLGADRYAYMPLFGLWILIGAAVTAKPVVREVGLADLGARIVGTALLAVLVAWGVLSFRVTRHWAHDETLWSYTLEVDPDNRIGLQNLGTIYASQQRYEEAVPLLSSAIRLDPSHNIAAPLNLGVVLHSLGRAREAVPIYENALVYNPDSSELHNNLAAAYWELGNEETAQVHMRRVEELKAAAQKQR